MSWYSSAAGILKKASQSEDNLSKAHQDDSGPIQALHETSMATIRTLLPDFFEESSPLLTSEAPSAEQAVKSMGASTENHDSYDANQTFDVAIAGASGRVVLLYFSAIWCRPCQQMDGEVLSNPAHADALKSFAVAKIDGDHPSSVELKKNYGATFYPVIIALSSDGSEIDRQAGYPGTRAMLQWLDEVQSKDANPTAEIDPAKEAWSRLFNARDGAEEWYQKAIKANTNKDDPYLRMYEVISSPTLEKARWLTENYPDKWEFWAWDSMDVLTQTLEGKELYLSQLREGSNNETIGEKATRYQFLFDLSLSGGYANVSAEAVESLDKQMASGAPLERSAIPAYAQFQFYSGDVLGAQLTLEKAVSTYPNDPTFWHIGAELWGDPDGPYDYDKALNWAHGGMKIAWGDNYLKLVITTVKILNLAGRTDEANLLANEVLSKPIHSGRAERFKDALVKEANMSVETNP